MPLNPDETNLLPVASSPCPQGLNHLLTLKPGQTLCVLLPGPPPVGSAAGPAQPPPGAEGAGWQCGCGDEPRQPAQQCGTGREGTGQGGTAMWDETGWDSNVGRDGTGQQCGTG